MPLTILLVDDHTIVRQGLRALLDQEPGLQVVAEASTGAEALAAAAALQPQVAVTDYSLPDLAGAEVIAGIRACSPQTQVLVLSMHDSEDAVRPAVRAGARGYLVKGSGLQDLVLAVHAVAQGQAFFSPSVAARLVNPSERAVAKGPSLAQLSPRERQVLHRVAEGQTSQQIADDFGISLKTVEGHRANLMAKLDLHDVPALVRFAVRSGLVGL